MSDTTLKCPKCGAEIPLTEGIAAPMVEAVRTEMQARVDAATRQAKEVEAKAKAKEDNLEEELQARMKVQREQADVAAKVKARAEMAADFACEQTIAVQAQQEAEALRIKLADAQKAQAEALRKERELADRERELSLTVETQVSAGIEAARTAARHDADEANRLRLLEKDTLLESMQRKVEELNQKITQGSQQMQGEVQELDLQAKLTAAFPFDQVGEVGKGVNGADVTQIVVAPSGAQCGLILYESKRTKNWSAGWLPKLREDGRAAKADILVLVSTVLPEEVEAFNQVDSVWVCSPAVALPLALALRATLLAVHATKQAQEGMATKAESVYAYVTGPQFRHRVEALVESFTTLQDDLVKEQSAAQRQWAKRAVQLERVMSATSGMFGDLQGIAGAALPEPEGLALPQ